MQVQEITNFRSGIDVSLEPFLSPIDAFLNLTNGYVHRGVLRCRKGYLQFANGGVGNTKLTTSRLAQQIIDTTTWTSIASATQTINIGSVLARNPITISLTDAVHGAKSINIYYNSTDGTSTFIGDVGVGGTINWETGAISAVFDVVLTGGDAMTVTYSPDYEDTAVLGIHEYRKSDGTVELIACDQNYFYKYVSGNNLFQQVQFAGTASAFSNTIDQLFRYSNWRAIDASGGVGNEVFTDLLIFVDNNNEPAVYDGTDIQLLSDRTEYSAPPQGTLNKALHVFPYGERLIFLSPTIDSKAYPQAVLWAPINDLSGSGLDFSGNQSGILSANTNSIMSAAMFLGDTLIVWFETDVFALELTDDAFAPFRWTRLEHDRGCEAPYSAVGFLGTARALGKLGILGTDGRTVGRYDNKIPFFTRDDVDPDIIKQVYGIADETDSQYWIAYGDAFTASSENDRILINNSEENNWAIYEIDLHSANKTVVGKAIAWDDLNELWDDAVPVWDKWGILDNKYKLVFGDHHGFIFYYGDAFVDSEVRIRGITAANPAVITTEPCPFQVGDSVMLLNVDGMTEINTDDDVVGIYPTITAISSDRKSVTLNVDSSNYTAYTSGGLLRKRYEFEAEFVPFSPGRSDGKKTYIGRMDFLIKSGTGSYIVDFYDDRRDDDWTAPIWTYTFESENDDTKRDRWYSIYVDHEADFHRFKVTQKKILEEVSIKSIRIHYKLGGESNV